MSPNAHPSDETLLRFAAGTLGLGPRVVVAAHLAVCPACRRAVRAFEAVGGALLEEALPPGSPDPATAALAPAALAATLDRIAEQEPARFPAARAPAPAAPPGLPAGFALPPALSGCALDPLRFLAPGVRMGRVRVPGDPRADVMLLRIGPGRAIPEHGHGGSEFTQILAGSYRDHLGHYGAGDLVEADSALSHTPRVDLDGECICLVAMEGPLRFRGVLGVVLRPFL